LGVVVLGVLLMAHAVVVQNGDGGLAVLQPALDNLGVVLAGVEGTGDGGGGKGGPVAPAARRQAVNHAAALRRTLLEVFLRLLDDALGDDDAGVAAGAQRLHLGDGRRALVAVAALLARRVIPAAPGRL